MGKLKRKRKKRSIATDVKAIYKRGMRLYLEEEEDYVAGLEYLFKDFQVFRKMGGQI